MESNSSLTSDLPVEVVDQVVKSWVDVLKIPTVSGGHFTEGNNFINITSLWSVADTGRKENVRFQRNFSLLKSSLSWKEGSKCIESDDEDLVMNVSPATAIDGKLICISRDGSRKAILVEKSIATGASEKGQKPQFLQIWSETTLLKSYDLSELEKHEAVYTSGDFGSVMVWNENADKVAYLAEKKFPKPKPFFASNVIKDDKANANDGQKKEESGARGEEYALRQSWGEQMQNFKHSVIVILDTNTDKFNIVELPADEFPADLQWVQNSAIIGTSYKILDWRLGLIYCTNRESRIFQINIDGSDLRFLSASGRAAFSPRVKPDGTFVVWQERAVDEPHNRARNIMGVSVNKGKTESPNCLYDSAESPNLPIYENFPQQHCWKRDGSSFFVITPKDGVLSLMCMRFSAGKVESEQIVSSSPGVDNILFIGENYMLLSRSSMISTPEIELIEVSRDNRRAQITKGLPSVPNTAYSSSKIFGQASVPSFFVGPEGCPPSSVPLVVWVHGGPHMCFVDSFTHESTFLMRLGFAFLKVNYIGSLGAKKRDETGDLLGKIGFLDVADSQNIVEQALKTFPSINSKQVGVWGGSHGGFLTCHLISQFPDCYQAAVARNPVCDLNVMMGTSDITDWVYAEVGLPFPANPSKPFIPAAKSAEETEKCFKASPISHVSKVKAATLLCVGNEDVRVPMSQGLSFYRALKAYGKTAEVRVYPDCHPLSTVPVRLDNVIHAALWFKKFIK